MPIPPNVAYEILNEIRDWRIERLFAQSNASYVLNEVGEDKSNFPRFDPALVEKNTMLSYSILTAGISLAEQGEVNDAANAMEHAAILLNNVHQSKILDSPTSAFHILVASMAFYASGQYSRAFVSMKKVETQTDLAQMISLFIRKRTNDLIAKLNKYLLADLNTFNDALSICEHSVTTSVARSLSFTLEYLSSGNEQNLNKAKETLDIAVNLAINFNSPSLWCITRLLRLIIYGIGYSSLWENLPPFFPKDSLLLKKYIRLMLFSKKPTTELWLSQKIAIPLALDRSKSGIVINMRTSSGKTRVAELAILQTLIDDPTSKVLYLAPFRSLAIEIEQTLSQIFNWCGFQVSHLYGGFRVSASDRKIAEDANITIATPEKARAILRSSPELFENVKLIVVDEGHLLGANERFVKNELFLDHLRYIAKSTNCRILMLSAVLPNPAQLAEWISSDSENVARSDWKPSTERFGFLRWQGDHVRIDWKGEFESFNPRFIQSSPLGWGRRRNLFPNDKKEAVAATAVRLMSVGPVMIFSARANAIPGLAKSVLLALGENPVDHRWPETPWSIFQTVCEEELPPGSIELKAARFGVICHSNKLPNQVRMATERLMRSYPPKIIIASTTLAQGVNIGISTVIVANPYIDRRHINYRDFWNICGRAGRAFIDGEGKILYAIDQTRQTWQIQKDEDLAEHYFATNEGDPVKSGLLHILNLLHGIAQLTDVDFSELITMIAENDFSSFEDNHPQFFSYVLDLIDDGLLAMHEDMIINPNHDGPEVWVDKVFRGSLAYLQAKLDTESISSDDLIRLLTTRSQQILSTYPDSNQRKSFVASGLPISTAKNVYRDRDLMLPIVSKIYDSEMSIESITEFIAWLEDWSRDNAKNVVEKLSTAENMDLIRNKWLSGTPMKSIIQLVDDAHLICRDVYGYQLPWLVHAISQQLRVLGEKELSDTLSSVALIVELGVPSEYAANIFLAGIYSRFSSTEISECGINLGAYPSSIRKQLRDIRMADLISSCVSEKTQVWLDIFQKESIKTKIRPPRVPLLKVRKFKNRDTLVVRRFGNDLFLCSIDGTQKLQIPDSQKDAFENIADNYKYSFIRHGFGYKFENRSPRNQPFSI